ncbi:hypothetical protein EG329_007671 [Mollisiaceae sp. DMI_Dod_QoI]|nr:hypothetical protein EG329_007671 [Helotiales sp. DMI_Dod_QoI]
MAHLSEELTGWKSSHRKSALASLLPSPPSLVLVEIPRNNGRRRRNTHHREDSVFMQKLPGIQANASEAGYLPSSSENAVVVCAATTRKYFYRAQTRKGFGRRPAPPSSNSDGLTGGRVHRTPQHAPSTSQTGHDVTARCTLDQRRPLFDLSLPRAPPVLVSMPFRPSRRRQALFTRPAAPLARPHVVHPAPFLKILSLDPGFHAVWARSITNPTSIAAR